MNDEAISSAFLPQDLGETSGLHRDAQTGLAQSPKTLRDARFSFVTLRNCKRR